MAMYDAEMLHKFTHITVKGVRHAFNEVKDELSWTENESILDVGCGTGVVTTSVVTEFAPANSNIIAADISEEMIKFAKKTYSETKVTFKMLDITDDNLWANWEKEQFTKVFSFYVIHRIKNDRKAYHNMFNMLKPGGEMLILCPIEHMVENISLHLAKLSKYKDFAEELCKMKFHISPREDHVSYTCEVLKSIGFEIIVCKLTNLEHHLGTVNDLVELYGLGTRASDVLPKNLYEEALEDSKTIIKENKIFQETIGGCTVKYTGVVVFARKPY